MSESLLAAVVQMTSTDDAPRNLERAGVLVQRAGQRGASLVVLPENVAYMGPDAASRAAVAGRFEPGTAGEGTVARFAHDLARATGCWTLWGGVPEARDADARVYNAAVLVAPDGVIAARYRKVH